VEEAYTCLLISILSSGYRFLEHITDAKIEARGATLEEAFENAASALEDLMVDISSIKATSSERISVEGKDKEALLYSWLESLIIKQDTEGMLYSKFDCNITKKENGFRLEAKVSGEKFDPSRHEPKTAVKAPTYHEMEIKETQQQVTLRFLLDL
jgi:SHS2 domain-containing protein